MKIRPCVSTSLYLAQVCFCPCL